MQDQFNEVAARASARAIQSVEALIFALGMRLSMLRNTLAAFTLAANERPDDMAQLHLPAILESLTALLPDDESFTDELAPVAEAFMRTLTQAAEAERQRAVPPELLTRVIETLGNGCDVEMAELETLGDALLEAGMADVRYGDAQRAFYVALQRNGIAVSLGVSKGKPFRMFERASSTAKAKPKAAARKRDRLTA